MSKFFGPHWRTTVAGILVIIGAGATALATVAQGGHVDWTQLGTVVAGGIGLVKAADAAAR